MTSLINFLSEQDTLGQVLFFAPFIFAPSIILVARTSGYYDSDLYTGHGTAHPVKLEETTCERRVTADDNKFCKLPD